LTLDTPYKVVGIPRVSNRATASQRTPMAAAARLADALGRPVRSEQAVFEEYGPARQGLCDRTAR
jgi:hypothetical protein